MLKNKVALITGCASEAGIGFATAKTLASQGAKVVLTDVVGKADTNLEQLRERVAAITEMGGEAHALSLDVTLPEQAEKAAKKCQELYDGIDILFCNAGIGHTASFLEMPDDAWETLYRVNQKGVVNVCRAIIPVMIAGGGGSIILNSSMSGLTGVANYSAYTMTKFAVIGLMKCLADEFGKHNIRCNAICPGNIATAMGLREIRERSGFLGISVEEASKILEDECAMGKLGTPEDVANAVFYLASPLSSFVSGISVPVAGGMYKGL